MNNILIKEFEEVLEKNHFETYKTLPHTTDDNTHYYLVVGDTNTESETSDNIQEALNSIGFVSEIQREPLDLKSMVRNYGCSFDILASRENVDFCIEVNLKHQNRARFKRVSKRRLDETIDKIKLIGVLSDKSNYSYTDEEIDEISMSLQKEVQSAIARFRKTSGNKESKTLHQIDSELNDAFQELKIRQKDIQKDLNLLAQQLGRNSRAKEKDK